VQLYVRSLNPEYTGPDKALKAFGKVAIEPGETAQVSLTLEERDFMLYDTERKRWRVAGESFEIWAGGSSDKLPLRAEVRVKADPRTYRRILTRLSPLKYFLENPTGRALLTQLAAGTPFEGWLDNEADMMTTIPIGKLVNFAGVPEAVIENIITRVNEAV
jgi:beta-glucosidase